MAVKNQKFWPKIKIVFKSLNFVFESCVQKLNFWSKGGIMVKIQMSVQKSKFRSKLRMFGKNHILIKQIEI